MTLEKLQERLKGVEAALEKERSLIVQHQANFNLLEGAKQECHHWIEHIMHVGTEIKEEFKDAIDKV